MLEKVCRYGIYKQKDKKKGESMALPITPTPKLDSQESEKFLKRVERDLKRPVGLTPTPRLKKAEKAIRRYAASKEE